MAESLLECMRSSPGDAEAEAAESLCLSWFYVPMSSESFQFCHFLRNKLGNVWGSKKMKPRHEEVGEQLDDTLVDGSSSECVITDTPSPETLLPVPTPSLMKHDNQLGEIEEAEPTPSPATWHLLVFRNQTFLNAIGVTFCFWEFLPFRDWIQLYSVFTQVPPLRRSDRIPSSAFEKIQESSMAAPRMN